MIHRGQYTYVALLLNTHWFTTYMIWLTCCLCLSSVVRKSRNPYLQHYRQNMKRNENTNRNIITARLFKVRFCAFLWGAPFRLFLTVFTTSKITEPWKWEAWLCFGLLSTSDVCDSRNPIPTFSDHSRFFVYALEYDRKRWPSLTWLETWPLPTGSHTILLWSWSVIGTTICPITL